MKKCSKCGMEHPDNIKFCPECGGQVTSVQQIQTYKLHCKSCNGTLTIEEDSPVLSCPFCGSKELIAESDAVTVERIKQKTHRDIEMGKQQLERERMQHDDEVAEKQEKANAIRKFKKSFMGVMLIVVTILSVLFCAVSFNDGRILSGVIAIIMGILCISSYLMGLQVIKEKFKGMRIITAIIAFVLIIPYFSLYMGEAPSHEAKPEDFDWTILEMHEYLPEPPSTYGTIGLDYDDHLSIDVYKISYAEYKEYRNECIESGYDKETSGGGDTYYAYNDDGFSLSLFYYEDDEKLGIILRAPEEETESTRIGEVKKSSETPTETSTESKSSSKYEKAFIRILNSYELIYMFDTDKQEVIYFATNDTFVQKGIYSGDFSSGIDINWVNDGYHETFTYKSGDYKAMLSDDNGSEWDYYIFDVKDAQDILDSLN